MKKPIDCVRDLMAKDMCPWSAEMAKKPYWTCCKYGQSYNIARGDKPCTVSDFKQCPLIQGK